MPDPAFLDTDAFLASRNLGQGSAPSAGSYFPDDARGREQSIPVTVQGYAWTPFPSVQTPYVRGAPAGAVQIRRRSGLNIRSRVPLGDWSPGSLSSVALKGVVDENTVWPPTGTFADNDYYRVTFKIATASRVIAGLGTVYPGDCIVRSSGAWAIQSGPNGVVSPSGVAQPWWNVTAAGYFDGVSYAIGDRIVQFGAIYYHRYYRGRPDLGEHFVCGEWAASTTAFPVAGTPAGAATPQPGDIWQVSAAGTAGGITFAVDDWAVYYYNPDTATAMWGKIATETIYTANNGVYLQVQVNGDLSRFEVRRQNKSTTEYNFKMRVLTQPARRGYANQVVMFSDSEGRFAGQAFQAALGSITLNTAAYSSGGSFEIDSLQQASILMDGDPYYGMPLVALYGQNNEVQPEQAIATFLRMRGRMPANDVRMLPCTAPGRATVTWNGTRFVGEYHEPMKARDPSNLMAQQELMLAQHFDNYINTRKVMADSVTSTIPHLHFPGMSEQAVAAAYGIIPLSYYYNFTGATLSDGTLPIAPWVPSQLNYQGVRSAAGAPTGGSPNDYWIRSVANGGSFVGNIYVNEGGTWVEYQFGSSNNLVHPMVLCKGWVDWSAAVVLMLKSLKYIR